MQSVSFSSSTVLQSTTARRASAAPRLTSSRVAPRVVCSAQKNVAEKAAAVAAPLLIASQPALALVDDRLGGEGTGKILGVGGPEGWAILIVFAVVWALFYSSTKVLGDGPPKRGKGDDSGLSL